VAIAGAGMLGLIAGAMCRRAGAKRIFALDINEERLGTVGKFGVDFGLNLKDGGAALTERLAVALQGEPVTVALDYSGAPDTMEVLLGLLGIGGTAVFVGATFPQRAVQVNAEQLIRNLHTIKGLHNYNGQDFIAAARFMEQNHRRFPFESLVHDKFNLDTVNEAFDYGVKSGAYRVGVRIGSAP